MSLHQKFLGDYSLLLGAVNSQWLTDMGGGATWWCQSCFPSPPGTRLRPDSSLRWHPFLASPLHSSFPCSFHLRAFTRSVPGRCPISIVFLSDFQIKPSLRRTWFLSLVLEKAYCCISRCPSSLDIAHFRRRLWERIKPKTFWQKPLWKPPWHLGLWGLCMEGIWIHGPLTPGPALFPQLTHCLTLHHY